ncbi:MAG TPA: VanZ family protein [Ghiorsea sp.]|nr:VanZ family protein [Ghiorsea sp.]HIP07846.1 VanZ family protein [Mariprofundaceae bacterium]
MKLNIILLLGYCGFIFMLSHQPSLPAPMLFLHQDKLIHATAYAIMALLAWRVFLNTNQSRYMVALISILFCSLYGVSDEFHQSFIDGRDADVWDWLADTIGASLMVFVLMWFPKLQSQVKKRV